MIRIYTLIASCFVVAAIAAPILMKASEIVATA